MALIKILEGYGKKFLEHCFKQEKIKGEIIKLSRGIRQANISNDDIYSLNLISPPFELQNTFAERVEKIEAQKEAMTASLKELEDNFKSLMQRAFKGEVG